ncbi:HNH endonuclease [Coraliomargarita parva]|uniref:HNH endonuclease n=1 Tax=Coraliomargarita parva TaxID=3014050 RepID=UPI0022B471EF|nr:hypothetical protein [Coraliomargarita parva]
MKNTPTFNKIISILRSGKQTSCVYCGYSFVASPEAIRFATVEHLLPQAKTSKRRGSNCQNNTYLCCYKCNTIRRDSLPEGIIKDEIENPSSKTPSWLVEVNTGKAPRYYIKTKKMRDKLIREIKEQFIIPESRRLFETWTDIVWNIQSEKDLEEDDSGAKNDTVTKSQKKNENTKRKKSIPKENDYPPGFNPYVVDLRFPGTFGSQQYDKIDPTRR